MFGPDHQESSRACAAGAGCPNGGLQARVGERQRWETTDGDRELSRLEEAELLTFFSDTEEVPSGHPMEGPTNLTPVPMAPPQGRPSPGVTELSPLTMTALQQLVAADGRVGDLEHRERTWIERRRTRRSERLLLNAALLVTAVLISGAFAFVKLEDSVASSRHEADQLWLTARNERRAAIEADNRAALAAASLALAQPRWTDLLSYVKDGRRLLSEIRDHFSEWPYAPFHDPELGVVRRDEDDTGVVRVWVRVDGSKPWASTIVMQEVNGEFKLDWPSFQQRFEGNYPRTGPGSRMVNGSSARGYDLDVLLQGGDAFLSTFPSLSLSQDLPLLNWGESAYLGMTAEPSE